MCMGFYVYRSMSVTSMIDVLLSQPDQYADFEFLGYCQAVYNNVIAVVVFLAWIKVKTLKIIVGMGIVRFNAGPNFIELLKPKILLKNFLLSGNEQGPIS